MAWLECMMVAIALETPARSAPRSSSRHRALPIPRRLHFHRPQCRVRTWRRCTKLIRQPLRRVRQSARAPPSPNPPSRHPPVYRRVKTQIEAFTRQPRQQRRDRVMVRCTEWSDNELTRRHVGNSRCDLHSSGGGISQGCAASPLHAVCDSPNVRSPPPAEHRGLRPPGADRTRMGGWDPGDAQQPVWAHPVLQADASPYKAGRAAAAPVAPLHPPRAQP